MEMQEPKVDDGSGEILPEPSPPPDPQPGPEDIPDFEEQVRAALGSDETLLPDEIIGMPLYKGKALRYMREILLPDTLEAGQMERWQTAVVYKTALLLLPYFRAQWKKIRQAPGLKEENFEINWTALEKQLQGGLDEETAALTGGGVRFSFFAITNRGPDR